MRIIFMRIKQRSYLSWLNQMINLINPCGRVMGNNVFTWRPKGKVGTHIISISIRYIQTKHHLWICARLVMLNMNK